MLKINHSQQQSETCLVLYFDEMEQTRLAIQIADFAELIRSHIPDLIEVIPSAASLYIEFHILSTSISDLEQAIHGLLKEHSNTQQIPELLELPIYYHPEVAPDLESLARESNLSMQEVIQIHSATTYSVVSLGFAPGFAYLSGLDPRLATPRLSTPKVVAKGSLGIADQQTAIYPSQSPGGWSILGNCPLDLYNLTSTPITLFQIGMKVKFNPITRSEFLAKGGIL